LRADLLSELDGRGISAWLRKMVIITKVSAILFVANFMMKPGFLGLFQWVDSMAADVRLPGLPVRAVHNYNNTPITTVTTSNLEIRQTRPQRS
jgi:hypothetical protein